MPRDYSNKLSVYLIKEEYANDSDILKNIDNLESEQINDFEKLYYGESQIFPPAWLKKFFADSFENRVSIEDDNKLKIYSASAKALLMVRTSRRVFAITFGYGRSYLKPGVWEERFGLKVLANIIDPDNIWSIDKKNMSITPKLVTEQMSKRGSVADFGIDIEQDLLQGMTGKSKYEEFGQTVTGKDALSLSIKINFSNIKDFLDLCFEKYNSTDYKNNFEWIDHIAEIKSPDIVNTLNIKLIEKIVNLDLEKIWMAIPDIIPWEKISEFRLASNQISLGDDIDLKNFIDSLDEDVRNNLTLQTFKEEIIECISAENGESIDDWKAYNCLYGEITENGNTCILSNGKWYEIEINFADLVNTYFESVRSSAPAMSLPSSIAGEHEDVYNERAATECLDTCCMDRKLIAYGGGASKIEFCDLLANDKKIIHVKRYGASSVLSHLFSQGLVSGDLFLSDQEFRNKIRDILPSTYKSLVPNATPDPTEYTIIFAVISKSNNLIDIPFFSKVNLRNTIKRLNGSFRYNVSFIVVKTEEA